MLMHAITRGGVRTHVRESALKVDSVRKIPCRTGESNLCQRRASPMLYQLSYIPNPKRTIWDRKVKVEANNYDRRAEGVKTNNLGQKSKCQNEPLLEKKLVGSLSPVNHTGLHQGCF